MNKSYFFNQFIIVILAMSMLIMLAFSSCKKGETEPVPARRNISGSAQKGPFINGSSITVYDYSADLSPTGKTFNAQINDDGGNFVLSNLPLSSTFVSVRADGFYFNEVTGLQSASQITLYAIAELSTEGILHVNLLTHLEKPRVEYLMTQEVSYIDAKKQAQQEILHIFGIDFPGIPFSEYLDITKSGEGNAILLAISSILQGFRTEAEMTALLSNISKDIRTDGALDDLSLGSQLINHAIYLDTMAIRNNLTWRYNELGLPLTIPAFGSYISNFISETSFVVTKPVIDYPKKGSYGYNILSLADSIYWGGENSVAATAPLGTYLKIRVIPLEPNLMIYYLVGSNKNWRRLPDSVASLCVETLDYGTPCDIGIAMSAGRYKVHYYEKTGGLPTRTRNIQIL